MTNNKSAPRQEGASPNNDHPQVVWPASLAGIIQDKAAATEVFARANRWRVMDRAQTNAGGFSFDRLIRRSNHRRASDNSDMVAIGARWFDHPDYFVDSDRLPAAIVVHCERLEPPLVPAFPGLVAEPLPASWDAPDRDAWVLQAGAA